MILNALYTPKKFAIRICIKVKNNDKTTTNSPKYKIIFCKINNTLKPISTTSCTINDPYCTTNCVHCQINEDKIKIDSFTPYKSTLA